MKMCTFLLYIKKNTGEYAYIEVEAPTASDAIHKLEETYGRFDILAIYAKI